jgi:hypothetical protein
MMDWPEPPEWLAVLASVVLAPLWALFLFLWMLHELIVGLPSAFRYWWRKHARS